MIPFVDLPAQYAQIADQVEPEILDILRTGAYVGGKWVERFEKSLATYLNANHVVGVSNGTDAITIALECFGIEGDVIVPNNSFIASAYGVSRAKMNPVLVDIDPETYLVTPEIAENAIKNNNRIRAIVVVHLYGQQPDMEAFAALAKKYDLILIEDAAQSIGSQFKGHHVGHYSHAATTSFYPTKNLGGIGQGGAIITNCPEIAKKARRIINQGSEEKYVHQGLGGNFRLDSLMAAHLYHALNKLDSWNAARQEIAAQYDAAFGPLAPKVNPGSTHIYHLYELACEGPIHRLAVEGFLKAQQIGYGFHYPHLISENFKYAGASTPKAEIAKDKLISLPMFPTLTKEQVKQIIATVLSFNSGT